MKLVIDSNIFIAALIREGLIRNIIVNFPGDLIIPDVAFYEVEKHKDELIEKSDLSIADFDELISELRYYVKVFPSREAIGFRRQAKEIIGSFDEGDVPFIATSLALDYCPIWSDDKHFQMQREIEVYTTKKIVEEFGF